VDLLLQQKAGFDAGLKLASDQRTNL